MDWKAVAAIWGAGLSTILAIAKVLEARPVFQLEPMNTLTGDQWYRIIVRNTSRYAILIKNLWSFQIGNIGADKPS